MWVGSSGIQVGSAHLGEEDVWHAWGASARVGSFFVGACGHFRRPNFTLFLPVCSSLPSLHSGIFKTSF
jgi:hypothetical protein